jgi:hypothetical protein
MLRTLNPLEDAMPRKNGPKTVTNGRDPLGRFAPGNRAAIGRRRAGPTRREYVEAIRAAFGPGDLANALVPRVQAGERWACELVMRYLVGVPSGAPAPSPDDLAFAEATGQTADHDVGDRVFGLALEQERRERPDTMTELMATTAGGPSAAELAEGAEERLVALLQQPHVANDAPDDS